MSTILKALSKAAADLNGVAKKHGHTYKDFDPQQVQMGEEIEKEHTDSPEVAKTIAADHLEEKPKYYEHPLFQAELRREHEKKTAAYLLGLSAGAGRA